MTSNVVFLALDFDGVLHHQYGGLEKTDFFDPASGVQAFKNKIESRYPRTTDSIDAWEPDGKLFDRAHHLEEILRQIPTIKIVLSTSWRKKIPFEYLTGFLSSAVQERIVGVLDYAENESMSEGVRGALMVKWMEKNGVSGASWFALDDQKSHYKFHPEHLIRTHWRGMDDNTVTVAIKRSEELSEKSALELTA
jgi:hypothetical protein